MMIRCIIVDDEVISHQILEKYISKENDLFLVGNAKNAIEAFRLLQEEKVDLIFLDINMPIINGISFLHSIDHPPLAIFTTAYKDYALEAFDLSAVDYLLKPFSFERFQIAISKVKALLNDKSENGKNGNFIIIETNNEVKKIFVENIFFIEAQGDYMKIYTKDGSILKHSTMKKMEEELTTDEFIRCHKSYIVSVKKIVKLSKNTILLSNKVEIPLSETYRSKVYEVFSHK